MGDNWEGSSEVSLRSFATTLCVLPKLSHPLRIQTFQRY